MSFCTSEAFESEESLHIVMDYAEGGDLASVIRETVDTETLLPQPWVREAAVQMASALDYMHSRGVIHCDLKPGNTMLLTPFSMEDAMNGSRPHVLLVDFGLAEIFDEQVALGGPATVKGSPAYLSPEGFDGKLTQKIRHLGSGCNALRDARGCQTIPRDQQYFRFVLPGCKQ